MFFKRCFYVLAETNFLEIAIFGSWIKVLILVYLKIYFSTFLKPNFFKYVHFWHLK